MPTITTERLLLEPLAPSHAAELAPVLDDPALHAFTGGRPLSVEELRARYGRQARGRSDDGTQLWFNWVIRDRTSGEALGFVQATVAVATRVADIAWVVGSRRQGHRYASEAAAAMVSWLRGTGIAAVTAHIHPANLASIGVARSLGLVATAVVVDGEVRWEG